MALPPDPTNPDLFLGILAYLSSSGIVRDPRDATHPDLPPLWIEPKLGVPAPGEEEGIQPTEVGTTLVAAIGQASGIVPAPYEGFLRNDGVQFVVRGKTPVVAKAFENQVRAALNDKRGWMMANVPVNESLIVRDLQLVEKNNLAFTYTMEYMFSLWGPFTPVGP